jgi:hypothetical protein
MKLPLPLAKFYAQGDESEWRGLAQCRIRPTHVVITNGVSDGVKLEVLVLEGEASRFDRSYDLSALEPLTAGQWRLPDDVGWQWAARFIVLRIKGSLSPPPVRGHTGPDGSIVILGDAEPDPDDGPELFR